MKILKASALRGAALTATACVLSFTSSQAQEKTSASNANTPELHELQEQIHELRSLLNEMRAENAQSRAEMQQLRQDLEVTRETLQHAAAPVSNEAMIATRSPQADRDSDSATASQPQDNSSLEQRVQKLEDSTSLIGSKIDEQYQTKVETASKYRARLHGIVLMNAFRNVGNPNSLDIPDYAQPVDRGSPQATIGATLRQSEIGLEIFGPRVAGARTSGDVQLDFAGGFPATGNGVNFGIVRLQTASLRFDWQHTSVVAGQDSLFISPLSPTSFASLATPAFAFAGNLWGWIPQLRLEHRFSISDQQTVSVQAGILDNLDWEFPMDPFYRYPQAGEASGQPAYALRTAWTHPLQGHSLSFGTAGYYGRQNWDWSRYVDAWAGMADWQIPIVPRVTVSGELYRGRGIGGLGAGVGRSIVYGGSPNFAYSPIRGLDTAGGWTQLKFQLTPKLELNGVVSEDDAFTGDIRGFASDADNGTILGRNRGALGNMIFRPRSDLVLAAEFRRLRSFPVYHGSSAINQVNLAVGILF